MKFHARFLYLAILISVLAVSCSENLRDEENVLFESLPPSKTGIHFENNLFPTEEFNMYAFRSFYNGGGVAVGDVNSDGLPDIFFTGNMVSNRLYLNRGDFKFEDVTEEAGLLSDGVWSAGVSFADVTGNGLLDIYITKSGRPGGARRHNELFINMGIPENGATDIPVFEEKSAEYGLDATGLSTQAVFFDYDGDGDLDMYLLNTSFDAIGGYENITGEARQTPDPEGGNKLFRNDTPLGPPLRGEEKGVFTDVTDEAGIYSSRIAFGLSASVADVNRDGWPDIYVANDFFERDYLYINNRDGTFREVLEDQMNSISLSSMGSDIADLTNNGWPDVYVADMYPYNESRKKVKMHYETYSEYQQNVEKGFHHQVTRNTLQLNLGKEPENHNLPLFSEIGRLSGVEASDWSWAVLLADYDHNGHTDIYVTNGIYKDLLDQDYIHYMSDPNEIRGMIQSDRDDVIMTLMERIPSEPQPNFLFSGEGSLHFTNQSDAWGLAGPGFSSGAAWGDLNGDGALDLVVSDVNGLARVYRNRTTDLYPERGWLFVELLGVAPNTQAIGAKVEVWAGDGYWYREHMLQRGFQSSVAPGLHVGMGDNVSMIDSLRLRWPDGRISRRKNIQLPARITLSQVEAEPGSISPVSLAFIPGDLEENSKTDHTPFLQQTNIEGVSQWAHQKYNFNEFDRERLLTHMHSMEGPALCTGDINGDSLQDLYTGGAREQPGALWVQNPDGGFTSYQAELFQEDAISEDIDCAFFDATGNGVDDLYVVSGGNSFSSSSSALSDRFYLNDGAGNFSKTSQILPTTRGFDSGSVVAPNDFNGDDNMDLFIGTRLKPFAVGLPVNGYLLAGDGEGNFTDVTDNWAPDFLELGMITDAIWVDLTGDQQHELVISGEWMPIRVFEKNENKFEEITDQLGLSGSTGWWNSLAAGDIDGDGRVDLVAANHGFNSMFNASEEYPVKVFVGDIFRNGMIEQVLATAKDDEYYPVALRHEMVDVIPVLRERFPDYASYGGKTINQLFADEEIERTITLSASQLGNVVIWNRSGGMQIEELPPRAQLSPMFGIELQDLDGDEKPEIILGGNLYNVKPHVGQYDASHGVVLSYKGGKMQSWPSDLSGLNVSGEIRDFDTFKIGDKRFLIAARNNNHPVILQISRNSD